MLRPLYVATERFGPEDGDRWDHYIQWAKIPALTEVVGLDCMLCRRLLDEINDEDWKHIVIESFRSGYFYHLDYLLARVADLKRRNILGVYRNPDHHISEPPGSREFVFMGYDLIDEQTQISSLTNCGGFPEVFSNEELNACGLLPEFARATEVRRLLKEAFPKEPHAQTELYAIWRLNE
jgi:hypothetical protein